jgi:hypothetical protein
MQQRNVVMTISDGNALMQWKSLQNSWQLQAAVQQSCRKQAASQHKL